MTKDRMKLRNIESLVKDMVEKTQGSSYMVDLSFEVEELASILDLDITFDEKEIKILTKANFMIHNDRQTASKLWKKIPIFISKNGYLDYSLTFGKGRYKELENSVYDDLDQVINSRGEFFSELYADYKKIILDK